MRLRSVLGLLCALSLTACGDDRPSDYLIRCDITEMDCQRAIYGSVANYIGFPRAEQPPVRVISVSEYERELRAQLNMDDDNEALTRALQLLGFVPEASDDVAESEIELLVENVGAYYCPPGVCSPPDSITIIDRNYSDFQAQVLLAHEFVHALQERQFGFLSLYEDVNSEDEALATRSVIEGDAQHISLDWGFEIAGQPLDAMDLDDLQRFTINDARMSARSSMTPFLDSVFLFPYGYGFDFMTDAWTFGEREEVFGAVPDSSLAILLGYEAHSVGEVPTTDALTSVVDNPPPGHTRFADDSLGPWYVYSALTRRGLADGAAWGHALRWMGDRFEAWESERSWVTSLWRIRFSDEIAAQESQAAFGGAMDARVFGNEVVVVVSEHPAAKTDWLGALDL